MIPACGHAPRYIMLPFQNASCLLRAGRFDHRSPSRVDCFQHIAVQVSGAGYDVPFDVDEGVVRLSVVREQTLVVEGVDGVGGLGQ